MDFRSGTKSGVEVSDVAVGRADSSSWAKTATEVETLPLPPLRPNNRLASLFANAARNDAKSANAV